MPAGCLPGEHALTRSPSFMNSNARGSTSNKRNSSYALAERNLLPSPERMKEIRQIVESYPKTVELRKRISESPRSESIDEILRKFQGPIQ